MIEIDPTVNAIVSSGYATDATMSRYQDFGFRGVIAKPYQASELGRIVHDVVTSNNVGAARSFDFRFGRRMPWVSFVRSILCNWSGSDT